jgi:hypothetical protein
MRQFAIGTLTCLAATPALAGKPTPPPPSPPPVSYDITWLNAGGPNDRFSVYDVNGPGTTAVGTLNTSGVDKAVSIDVATGTVTDLNAVLSPHVPNGWQLNSARGITDFGRFAGEATDELGNRVLYVYDAADLTPFQSVGETIGNIRYRDMNDMGDLLFAEYGTSNSYLYTHDGQETQLPTSLMTADQFGTPGAAAINNDRVIAGNKDGNSFATAYVYDGDTTTSIASYFQSREINNAGTVVGRGKLSSSRSPKLTAMKYENGVKTPLSGLSSEASDINVAGQVAGRINSTGRTAATPFVYDPTQGFWSLNDLIRDTAQDEFYWNCSSEFDFMLFVEAMSEPLSSGYPVIVGHRTVLGSVFPDGVDRQLGFILMPTSGATSSALVAASVPEPSSCLLVAIALLSLNAAGRRRHRPGSPRGAMFRNQQARPREPVASALLARVERCLNARTCNKHRSTQASCEGAKRSFNSMSGF